MMDYAFTIRTQAERLALIDAMLSDILEEMDEGYYEEVLQRAVDCQVGINRIVHRLNERQADDGR